MEQAASEPGPSDTLLEMVRNAVESGLDILRDSPRLGTMAILSCGGHYSLIAFESLDEAGIASELGERLHREVPKPEAYVLRYRGELVTDSGETADAIVIEGATLEMTKALHWAYLLEPNSEGKVLCIGECESYYVGRSAEPSAAADGPREGRHRAS
jgi:hypothetical protein